jgi:hypothetical protein
VSQEDDPPPPPGLESAAPADLVELRAQVDKALEMLTGIEAAIADFRRELTQTVTAANHWFVRARDELLARMEAAAPAAAAQASPFAPAPAEGAPAPSMDDIREEMRSMVAAMLDLQRDVRQLLRRSRAAGGGEAARRRRAGTAGSGRTGGKPTYDELIRMLVTGDFEG